MHKIPATMSTQHPDNANPAYWCDKSFISTTDEIEEAYIAFQDLGFDEYMWDWEGKFVDEAVIDKLYRKYNAYFKKHPLGKDKFLTYRIPNIWEERGYRLARAFINIVTSAELAEEMGFKNPPIIEVILPMTKTANQIIETEKTFRKVAKLKCEIFDNGKKCTFNRIDVIPLIERVEDLTGADEIIEDYLKQYKKEYGQYPEYMRPFIARSDPALNSGLIPAVLASKAAISHYYKLEKKYSVPMYPIIGTGSLPFRGSINPENIAEAINEYAGIRTITLQSAFKYDYPLESVRKAIKFIDKTLPKMKPISLSEKEIESIKRINKYCVKVYASSIEKLAPLVNKIAAHIPARRERMQHIGLFGYSRGIGKVSLPRAITFTGSFYSLGVPPELIGTGRALREAQNNGDLEFIKRLYINLERDLMHAGKYLNKENLLALSKTYPEFKNVVIDIQEIENILGIELGPHKNHHFLHRNIVSNIYYKMKMNVDFTADIVEAAKVRKSLG